MVARRIGGLPLGSLGCRPRDALAFEFPPLCRSRIAFLNGQRHVAITEAGSHDRRSSQAFPVVANSFASVQRLALLEEQVRARDEAAPPPERPAHRDPAAARTHGT